MKHTAWSVVRTLLLYTHVNGLPCWSLYLHNFLSLQTHQYQCPRFPVSCPNRCDPTKIPREEVEVHVQELCPSATMNCPFKEAGCKFKVSAYPVLMKFKVNAYPNPMKFRVIAYPILMKFKVSAYPNLKFKFSAHPSLMTFKVSAYQT